MNKRKYKGLDEILYTFKCDNGISVYLQPNLGSKNFHITIGTRFGGNVMKYKVDNKAYEVTPGIAHFIEHRVLDFTKDKEAKKKIETLGSIPNAMTNYLATIYFMVGSLDIKQNIQVLFDRVFSPNFKAEDIEKEKGIITEEYYMYQDNPTSVMYDKVSESLFHNYYQKNTVLGTPNDINSITKEEIERIYNHFYVPENMYVVITGNFDFESVGSFIKDYMDKIKYKEFKARVIIKKEPINVKDTYRELHLEVNEEKVIYALKCETDNSINLIKKSLYFSILINSLFGPTSDLYEKYKTNQLISSSFFISKTIEKNFFVLNLLVDTQKPKEYIESIKEDLKSLSVSEEDFLRKKKLFLSETIITFEQIGNANDFLVYYINKHKKPLLELHSIINSLNYKEFTYLLKQINQENTLMMNIKK